MNQAHTIDAMQVSQAATKTFNGFITAYATFAVWQVGLLDAIQECGSVNIESFAKDKNLNAQVLHCLCDVFVASKLFRNTAGAYGLTSEGERFVEDVGPIIWAVGGYGAVLADLGKLTSGTHTYGCDIRRDDSYVVRGSAIAARRYVLPHIYSSLDAVDPGYLVDLGCGSGRLLVDLCKRFPKLQGLGVDISEQACHAAQENVAREKMSDRIEIIRASCQSYVATHDFESALRSDGKPLVITCLFMMHDLMADWSGTVHLLAGIRNMFKRAGAGIMLIADDVKTEFDDFDEPPLFSLGFALTHAIMGVKLWTKSEYVDLFAEAGLNVSRVASLRRPSTWLYVLQ